MGLKVTNESFIEKANKIHNNKYKYEKTIYLKAIKKIIITCDIHGDFKQTPNSHLNGSGCPNCGRKIVEDSVRLSKEEFIEKANKIHNNYYSYENAIYNGFYNDIIVTCPVHGDFKQKVRKHLGGNSCKKCASDKLRIKPEDFIKRIKEIHNNYYSYEKLKYSGIYENIIVTCPVHGDFEIKSSSHLHKKRGCKKCKNLTSSIMEKEWLDMMNINNRNIYLNIGDKTLCVDGFDKENNIIYEFYGDFFHGNPYIYNSEEINPRLNEPYGSLYIKTKEREKLILEHGYNLITIWESDFKKINKKQ